MTNYLCSSFFLFFFLSFFQLHSQFRAFSLYLDDLSSFLVLIITLQTFCRISTCIVNTSQESDINCARMHNRVGLLRCGNKSYAIRLEIRAKRNRARTPESGERRVNDAMQRRVQKNGSKKVARRENAHTHKHTHTHTHAYSNARTADRVGVASTFKRA